VTSRRRLRPSEVADGRASALVRSAQWAGLGPGDPLEVRGTRLRSASWTFVAHVVNSATGEEWIEVVGGKPGDRKVRSFRLEQIYPAGGQKNRGARAPLAQSPQLPLG
jgi:hypothetical protein